VGFRIEFRPSASRQLRTFPRNVQRRLLTAIDLLAENPRPPKCKALRGRLKSLYRVRTGDYRIVYQVHDRRLLICILTVAHRKNVYRTR